MKIATWNVNSIKSRLHQLLPWLRECAPDVVLLQELKCQDDAFPRMEIEDLGYNLAIAGQKTYNGVAILSKHPIEDISRGLPGNEADEASRYIEGVISFKGGAVRVASVYVPNGQSPDSEKFPYKLGFLDHLVAHAKTLLSYQEMLVIGGDYNIAPYDIDVHNPKAWEGQVLCHPEERKRLRTMLNFGLCDAFRALHPTDNSYSWWDYRAASFEQNAGVRIDHLLLSPQATDVLTGCVIQRDLRGQERPSDHVPVLCELKLEYENTGIREYDK